MLADLWGSVQTVGFLVHKAGQSFLFPPQPLPADYLPSMSCPVSRGYTQGECSPWDPTPRLRWSLPPGGQRAALSLGSGELAWEVEQVGHALVGGSQLGACSVAPLPDRTSLPEHEFEDNVIETFNTVTAEHDSKRGPSEHGLFRCFGHWWCSQPVTGSCPLSLAGPP